MLERRITNERSRFNRTLLIRSDSACRSNGSRKEVKMSEITKLYENAGLSNMWVERYNDGYYEHERYYNSYKEMINNMMKANDWTLTEAQEVAKRECRKEHPPFTAEKQLEIVKAISTNHISSDYSYKYLGIDRDEIDEEIYLNLCIDGKKYHAHDKDFDVALAKLVNLIWQDLTSEEKASIKNILEM